MVAMAVNFTIPLLPEASEEDDVDDEDDEDDEDDVDDEDEDEDDVDDEDDDEDVEEDVLSLLVDDWSQTSSKEAGDCWNCGATSSTTRY